jgi:hypothetical protein
MSVQAINISIQFKPTKGGLFPSGPPPGIHTATRGVGYTLYMGVEEKREKNKEENTRIYFERRLG